MLTSATNKLKVCQTALSTTSSAELPPTTGPGTEAGPNAETKPTTNAKATYKQRKKAAIELTTMLLQKWRAETTVTEDTQTWTTWLSKMENSSAKKQDDLSDSFLQGLYVLRQHVVESKKEQKRATTAKNKQINNSNGQQSA